MQKGKKKIFLALFLGLLTCVSFAFGALGVSAANYYNADGSAFSWSFDANGVSSQIPYSDTEGTPVNTRYGMEDPTNNYIVEADGSTFVVNGKYIRMDLANGIDINKPFNVSFFVDENPNWTETQNRYLTLSLFGSVDSLMAYNHTEWWQFDPTHNSSVLSIALAEKDVAVDTQNNVDNRGKILGGRGSSTSQPLPTSYGDLVRQWHSFTFYVGTGGADSSYIAYANEQTHTTTPYHANATDFGTASFPEGKIYFAIGAYGSGMQIKAKISQPYSFVNFEANGGSVVAKQLLANGTKATEPTAPAKSGFRFMGWYTDAELTTRYDFNAPITADTTLYAKWRDSSLPVFTVDFNSNGGSGSMASVNDACDDYVLPDCEFTAPTGRFFKGWATSADGDVINETSITVNENITLYAIWGAYGITFHANGGSGTMAPINGITGEYTLPQCTFSAPAGKQFKGWSFSQNGIVLTYTTIAVNSDVELYAIWETVGGEQSGETTESGGGNEPSNSCSSAVFAPSTVGLIVGALGVVFAVKKKRDE